MVLAIEIIGWIGVVAGFIAATQGPSGLGLGAASAVVLGLAYAGAFNPIN